MQSNCVIDGGELHRGAPYSINGILGLHAPTQSPSMSLSVHMTLPGGVPMHPPGGHHQHHQFPMQMTEVTSPTPYPSSSSATGHSLVNGHNGFMKSFTQHIKDGSSAPSGLGVLSIAQRQQHAPHLIYQHGHQQGRYSLELIMFIRKRNQENSRFHLVIIRNEAKI